MIKVYLFPKSPKQLKWLLIRWFIIFFCFLGAVFFAVSMPGVSYSGPKKELSAFEVDLKASLTDHVVSLSHTIGQRDIGHYIGLMKAENYITSQFEKIGYTVQKHSFEVDGKTVSNIEVIIPGRSKKSLVVGAHYDSHVLSPAANDNATGVAAIIEIAKHLLNKKPDKTVRIVAFVNEEPPYFGTEKMGSAVYAKDLIKNNIDVVGMVSIETIGSYFSEAGTQKYPFIFDLFYPDRGNFIGFVSNFSSRSFLRDTIKIFRENTHFPSEGTAAPGMLKGIGWSDHRSFWKYNVPALMITDTAPYRYPHYHTAEDTWDKIDYDSMAVVVNGIFTVITQLAGSKTGE